MVIINFALQLPNRPTFDVNCVCVCVCVRARGGAGARVCVKPGLVCLRRPTRAQILI